jgi:putative ABC transport system permease protein
VSAFLDDTLGRIRQQPAARAAGVVDFLPFSGLIGDTSVLVEGQPVLPQERRPRVRFRAASEGYLETLGITVKTGRAFAETDRADSTPVTIINERAARELFPGGQAVGRRLALDIEAFRYFPDRPPEFDIRFGLREIVGVIADVKHSGLADGAVAEMYVPVRQRPARRLAFVVKSDQAPATSLAMTRTILREQDAAVPVTNAAPLTDLVTGSIAEPRFNATVLAAFGGVALALSIVGIYGVLSYAITLRRRDIGIHVAVGATPGAVVRLVLRETAAVVVIGIAAGVGSAVAAGPILDRMLFGVGARDPRILAAVAAVVAIAALVATVLPIRRALRLDPVAALQAE